MFRPNVAVPTVSTAVPDTDPDAAAIVVFPFAKLVASPVKVMVDTVLLDEVQVAEAVRF